MSRTSGQSKLKSCVHLTDRIANFVTWMVANGWINWHLTVAKCAVSSGLSQRLCLNKRAVRICVAGCFNCTKGDPSLVSETLHSHIILQSISLSLANCHPVQCRPNVRVADCAIVWVRKCLQLFYLPALHLTLFEIYIRNRFSSQSNKPVSFEQPATRMTLPMLISLCGKKARKTSAQICASESHS